MVLRNGRADRAGVPRGVAVANGVEIDLRRALLACKLAQARVQAQPAVGPIELEWSRQRPFVTTATESASREARRSERCACETRLRVLSPGGEHA